jgi:uncharacterized repeat protein (TIGR01451 family)
MTGHGTATTIRPALRPFRSRGVVALAIGAVIAAPLAIAPAPPATAVDQVPFSITIRHVNCLSDCDADGLEDIGESTPDFYAKVWINGVKLPVPSDDDEPSTGVIDNDDSIDPFWTVTGLVPADQNLVSVGIQLWDEDDTSGDDLADISSKVDDADLNFTVDRSTGSYSGEIDSPRSCSDGDGGDDKKPPARMCVDVGGDRDGDGLLDTWEQSGYDDDGDGVVDVDLPALGADPDHKDLFLEIDHDNAVVPDRAGIQAMRDAFAAAPLDVGSRAGLREASGDANDDTYGVSTPPNPDGTRGITLHVDTGALVDNAAREGQPGGTCSDGIDNNKDGTMDGADPDCIFVDSSIEDPGPRNCANGSDDDGDGLADAADPDCLVGDPQFAAPGVGQGQLVTSPGPCGPDNAFYAMKNSPQGLQPARRYLFRYVLSVQQGAGCSPQTGGRAEIGGNDITVFNAGAQNYGGTLMHELGHTLNLHHGGFEDHNCKPNYVSIMNYDNQSGVQRVGGGTVLDYSPPRTNLDGTGHRGTPGRLDEDTLDESAALDAGDPVNQFVFTDGGGRKVTRPLSSVYNNWNGDGDDTFSGADRDTHANIDTSGNKGENPQCANDDEEELQAADDWSYVSLSFHNFGDASDGALRPEPDTVPTSEQLELLRRSLNTTDLAIAQSDAPDPVAAGTSLTWTLTVRNQGPNPANSVVVTDELPAEVDFTDSSVPCTRADRTLTCQLGLVALNDERSFTITASVPAGLVHDHGGPLMITNKATVANNAGPDAADGNNESVETTRVIAVADVSVTSTSATSPLEVLVGQSSPVDLSSTVANAGPSSPVDAVVTTTATSTAGATFTPASASVPVDALAVGAPRTVPSSGTVACSAPGTQSVTVATSIALKNADDVDPDPTNNARSTTFTIDCVVPIVINVRPGGLPNSINLNTDATLAALTTRAGEYGLPLPFDATRIDVSRTRWGLRSNLFNTTRASGAIEMHNKLHLADSYELDERTQDGDLDGVLHFKPKAAGLTLSTTEACLKGKYVAPNGATYTFFGCDSVRVTN